MNFLQELDRVFSVLTIIWTVVSVSIGFLAARWLYLTKHRKIRKILSLKKCNCKIVLSKYDNREVRKGVSLSVCPIGDIQAAINVTDLIYETGLYSNQQSIIYEGRYSDDITNYNIFCIGGFLANTYSGSLFDQFFPNFKIFATSDEITKASEDANQFLSRYFQQSNDKNGFSWGNSEMQKFTINDDERYAIIVKLTNYDFPNQKHGTVHILFGDGVEGTLVISKYLLFNYNELYKMVKKHPNHYFIAFKLKKETMIIDPNSFKDLTDEMFNDNND